MDDKALKDIFKNLYYPDSPYEFSVLPADILGQVYEKFLGKVICLTPSHHAKIEEKPEVRKAGGVYYTPTYIVDYIVKNTVGKLVQGKKPGPRGAVSKLKILDPACGSGSFLIGAYQFLLDWHLDQYIQDDPGKWDKGKTPRVYLTDKGDWRLTTDERKRILINNIYGVDIDTQAVEVTKLSLLLKVLEGEDEQSIGKTMSLFQERVLPDLENNIKCGNSLIGPDFYDHQQMNLLEDEEIFRVNAFDWQTEFSDIMNDGGFDAVIGNPPYVDIKGLPEIDVKYIFENYKLSNNRVNLFASFVERVLSVLNQKRFQFSMIVPTSILTQESYQSLRKYVVNLYQISQLVRLPNESFGAKIGDVKVDTVIFVFKNKKSVNDESFVRIIGYNGYDRIFSIDANDAQINGRTRQSIWADSKDCIWSINTTESHESILNKCEQDSIPLIKCVDFSLGLTPYDKYQGHTQEQIKNKVFHSNFKKDETYKKLLAGNDIFRYGLRWNGEQWISYGGWLGAARQQKFFTQKRILVKQIIDWTSKRIWATITDGEYYNTQNAFNLLANSKMSLEYILGILNSRLLTFFHRKRFLDEFKMRFQKVLIKDCKQFPIREINLSNSQEQKFHNDITDAVIRILGLNEKIQLSKMPQEKNMLKIQIDSTNKKIDQMVYQLYGLTDEEIKIVESEIS